MTYFRKARFYLNDLKFIYGPIPSRRLGRSLGISPIPKKTCNYGCVYCMLGNTNHMTNTREMFFPVQALLDEFDIVLRDQIDFDVVSIVGDGEPTLYLGLGELIRGLRKRTSKPIAVITNGALLYDPIVRNELCLADIVLPTMDAYDEASFKKIYRPHKDLTFTKIMSGLQEFSKQFHGQLWLEILLMSGINDDDASIEAYAKWIASIRHDKIYLNTTLRPPTVASVKPVDHFRMLEIADRLSAIAIDLHSNNRYLSDITDDYQALKSIIRRHPMNQHEITDFLRSRKNPDVTAILRRLADDPAIDVVAYKGYNTYRMK